MERVYLYYYLKNFGTPGRKEDGAYTCTFSSEDKIYSIQSHLNLDGIQIYIYIFLVVPLNLLK